MAYPDLKIGDRGGDVRVLQQLVSEALQARPGLARDGVFGPLTQGALRRFQQARGLEMDGVVGQLTWAALSPSAGSASKAATVARPAPVAVRPTAPVLKAAPAAPAASRPAASTTQPPTRADVIDPAAEPPWFQVALAEYQLHHTTRGLGQGDMRIHEYFQATSLRPPVGTHDAWCSAFVNWCMRQAGLTGTDSAAAASWRSWGSELKEPKHGCVMVVAWAKHAKGDSGNHVTFFDRKDSKGVHDFGGNQGKLHAITHSFFPMSAVKSLNFRWPK